MTRVHVLPDGTRVLLDTSARHKRRLTPLKVFIGTFVLASLILWLSSQSGVRYVAGVLAKAAVEAIEREEEDSPILRAHQAIFHRR